MRAMISEATLSHYQFWEFISSSPFSSQYLLTVGGLADRSNVNLYSLEEGQSVPECLQNITQSAQLPKSITYGAGAALGASGEIPLICKGNTGSTACYRYNLVSNEWVNSGNLSIPHKGPGYTRHSRFGLVITGGFRDPDDTKEKVSETTLDGKAIKVSLQMSKFSYIKKPVDPL